MSAVGACRSAAVLLAAGSGRRMGRGAGDKLLLPLGGRPVFLHGIHAFAASGAVDLLVVAWRTPAQRKRLEAALLGADFPHPPVLWVRGGAERQDSVRAALGALPETVGLVYIHDAARPLVRPAMIAAAGRAARRDGAAVLAHRVADTIKEAPSAGGPTRRLRLRTPERGRLWAMETPQVFRRGLIAQACEAACGGGLHITDDASAVELAGGRITLVENPHPNPKLTTPADIPVIEALLQVSRSGSRGCCRC